MEQQRHRANGCSARRVFANRDLEVRTAPRLAILQEDLAPVLHGPLGPAMRGGEAMIGRAEMLFMQGLREEQHRQWSRWVSALDAMTSKTALTIKTRWAMGQSV